MSTLILKELRIQRAESWSKDAGKLMGSIKFTNQQAETTLQLSEEQATRMLSIVAEALAENAREIGAVLTANIIPALAAPEAA